MGANNLTFVAGGVIQTSHPNQYFTALSQDVVPRDASGVVTTAAGSLGSSTYKWDSIFFSGSLNIGSTANGNLIKETSNGIDFQTNSTNRVFIATSTGRLGWNTTSPAGNLHILSAGTVLSPASQGDEAVFQNTSSSGSDVGISLISGNAGECSILFGDTDDTSVSRLYFDNSTNQLIFLDTSSEQTEFIITNSTSDDLQMGFVNTAGDEFRWELDGASAKLGFVLRDAGTATTFNNDIFVRYVTSGLEWRFSSFDNTSSEKFVFTSTDAGAGDEDFMIENTDSSVSSTHSLLKLKYTNEAISSLGLTNEPAFILFVDSSGTIGQIRGVDNGATAGVDYLTSSDARLKEDLKDFDGSSIVNSIGVYDFKWKGENGLRDKGFMAQEVYKKLKNVDYDEDHEGFIGLDYGKMTPYLWKAVQELIKRVEELEKK
jgi:hypothetical protein